MKLLFHRSATRYRLFSAAFKLTRHRLHGLPPFPGQLIPITATDFQKKALTAEEIEKQGIRSVLLASPTSQLLEIIDDAALFHPNILHHALCIFRSDPTRRRVLVSGLRPGTTAEQLRGFFSRFGAVEEAAVARAEEDGHVVFRSVEAVQAAIRSPGEEIAAALGSGRCRVEWEEGDEEERRRKRKEKKIWMGAGLGQLPLRRVVFVPIAYY